MKRYWFEFAKNPSLKLPIGIIMGCGVTAYDEAQAMEIMKQHIFNNNPVPKIARVIPNVKIDELEKNHVLPNIGNPAMRGIWFPLGYNK